MLNPLMNLDRCVEVAGDDRGGRFLRKLFRWHGYTKVTFGGQKWVALTRSEWANEMGCSLTQLIYTLEKLGRKGLILREQHRYNSTKAVLFVRPSEKALLAMFATPGCGTSAIPGSGTTATPYINPSKKPGEETKTANGSAVASGEEGCISGVPGYPESTGNVIPFPNAQGGAGMPTAHEIAAGFVASAKKPIDTLKPDKVDSLVHVWREHSKEAGKVAPHFTGKARGQLKHLIKTWPKDQALEALAFALANWFDLTTAAEKEGAFKSPAQPELGYLVKYQHIALTLFLKGKAKGKPEPVVKPVQSIAPVLDKDADDKPATAEDFDAIFGTKLAS